eukprot:gene12221-5807_t
MKLTNFFSVLILTTLLLLTSAAIKKSKIRILTSKTIDEYLQDYGHVVVFFTSTKNECKTCDTMKQIYEISVKEIHTIEKSTDVLPTYFSCDENEQHKKYCEKMQIQRQPTIILFRRGKPFRLYSLGNDSKTLTDWIVKKTRPLVVLLKDKSDIKQYVLNSKEKKLVGYFRKGETGDKEYKMFRDLLFQDPLWSYFSPVGIVRDEKIADEEINGAPGLQFYNPKTKKPISIHQDELEKSRDFIIRNGYPLFSLINEDLFEIYTNSGLHTVLVHYKKLEDVQKTKLQFLEIASAKSGKMFFAYAPLNPQMIQNLESAGINTNNPVIVNSYSRNSKYPHVPMYFKGDSTNKQQIVDWIDGILTQRILPNEKSKDEL